jgi:hypothetical protein
MSDGFMLYVPRATQIRRQPNGFHEILWEPPRPPKHLLSDWLEVFLLGNAATRSTAAGNLSKEDRKRCSDLFVAAIHDILGVQGNDLWGPFPGGVEYKSERAVKRAGKRGRDLWRRLGAWPWAHFSDDSTPPQDWWTGGADTHIQRVYEIWRTGRM